jgi:hypothetical protein
MKGGMWVKCVKTITEIFIEGEFYHVSYRSGTYITVIDELGNGIGFDVFPVIQFLKLILNSGSLKKRGTEWATRRQQ